MNGNKDGESIAGTTKKPECIVSGGAATIAVSYQGQDILRLLHRLPRRVQRQPREVHQGREEMTPGLEHHCAQPRGRPGFFVVCLLFADWPFPRRAGNAMLYCEAPLIRSV